MLIEEAIASQVHVTTTSFSADVVNCIVLYSSFIPQKYNVRTLNMNFTLAKFYLLNITFSVLS